MGERGGECAREKKGGMRSVVTFFFFCEKWLLQLMYGEIDGIGMVWGGVSGCLVWVGRLVGSGEGLVEGTQP